MRKQIIAVSLFLVLIAGIAGYTVWLYSSKPTPQLPSTPEITTPPPTPEAKPLLISGPTWVEVGKEATFIVTSMSQPVDGATVRVAGRSRMTRADGTVSFMFNETGNYEVYVTKEGYKGTPQVLFQEDFSKRNKWFVHKDGILVEEGWSLENEDGNSFLHLAGEDLEISPRQDVIDSACLAWENYTVKVRARAPEGALEVIFRYSGRGDYEVRVNADGDGTYLIDLYKHVPIVNYTESYSQGQGGKVLEGRFEAIKSGTSWHEMEITALGKSISIYFDHKLGLNWTDNDIEPSRRPYLKGGVYFGAAHADMDDVVIKLATRDESAALTAIKVYPKGSEQISLRGAKEGVPDAKTRWTDPREIGANLVPFNKDYYVNMTTGSIESPQAWEPIIARIRSAHYRGLKVHFTPYLWRGEEVEWSGTGSLPKEEFLENAAVITLDCARFAENNGVEIFQPANVYEFVPHDIANEWYQRILPKIKEVYSGSVVLGLIYLSESDEDPSKIEFNYSGYDYISLVPRFPMWKPSDVGGLQPIYETYRKWVRRMIEVGLSWSEKYGTKGIYVPLIFTDFVEEFVKAEMKNGLTMGQIRAKVLGIFFQETAGHLKGCIVGPWEERLNQKCFYISAAMGGKEVTHTQANFWGYQGPEVEELVKKYYILD